MSIKHCFKEGKHCIGNIDGKGRRVFNRGSNERLHLYTSSPVSPCIAAITGVDYF